MDTCTNGKCVWWVCGVIDNKAGVVCAVSLLPSSRLACTKCVMGWEAVWHGYNKGWEGCCMLLLYEYNIYTEEYRTTTAPPSTPLMHHMCVGCVMGGEQTNKIQEHLTRIKWQWGTGI